ncbi:hypothetical protein [Sphaerimonospora thailandensis]|uniref:Uncharacterized protein n=1 Tax=Sphaerimonospora thailandensis TaxID=795644 RepID=A0A8J3RGN0_9ACTN|nr:hypothetical protein [Sphaerimonospora thailandensis]GIH72013.1 hypothetical protein Mth01_42660 [Sphaerimonospora thailandensis]
MDRSDDHSEQAVHVVVTCTNRKRVPADDRLRVRSLEAGTVGMRFRSWLERLEAAEVRVPARDLYAGEHWLIANDLAKTLGADAHFWVCSAGYGLIPAATPIAAYAATFASGHEDSVAEGVDGAREWWRQLCRWEGPQAGQPRSFEELANQHPDSAIVAVLSEPYLRACASDLRAAASRLAESDNLAVIGPADRSPELADLIVPVTAALRALVGGSLLSLNVRVARRLLQDSRDQGVRRSLLLKLMETLTAEVPEQVRRQPGIRMTDEEVRSFIRHHGKGFRSATPLLRKLRSSGLSCEQARFRTLFLDEVSRLAEGRE